MVESTPDNEPSKEAAVAGSTTIQPCNSVLQSEPSAIEETEPYSIYTTREKWFIVAMVAVSGLYSPLPANIYYPTIPTLSEVFHQSTEALNQSVTIYLVFQGICRFTTRICYLTELTGFQHLCFGGHCRIDMVEDRCT